VRVLNPTTKKTSNFDFSNKDFSSSLFQQTKFFPPTKSSSNSLSHPQESISFLKKRDFWMPKVVRKKY
jgi:hypothetical protein